MKHRVAIEPINDRVLCRRALEETVTHVGSIALPEEAIEKPLYADVIGVGRGRILESGQLVPPQVEVGDRVLLGKWAGTEIPLGEEKGLVLVREDEILGILRMSPIVTADSISAP